jgi:hypothetical protein
MLRVQQAEALAEFVGQLQEITGDSDVVILGDLNSYLNEDPILALEAAGLTNHNRTLQPEDRYTYVFFGQAGVLDYGMTTAGVTVEAMGVWHINADEPHLLDYNTEFNPADAYRPDAFRSSDHDPVLLGLTLMPVPLNVALDLEALTDSVAAEAELSKGAQAKLSIPLLIIQKALRIEARWPGPLTEKLDRVVRWQTERFISATKALRQAGELTESQAAPLLEQAKLLLGII